jgi:signal transduction histidine kinase
VLGGSFTLSSQAGAGTRLSLAIPLSQALAEH